MVAEGERPGAAKRGVADADSRARTHLANERTFLAWLRTGLNLIVLGIAVAQFIDPHIVFDLPLVTLVGVALVASGLLLTIFAGVHYRSSRNRIDDGSYRAPGRLVAAAVVLVTAAGLLALGVVMVIGDGSGGR